MRENPATGLDRRRPTRDTSSDYRWPQRHEPQSHHLSKACFFSGYGTAASGRRDVLEDSPGRLTALWRDKQLQYNCLRAVEGRHADFWKVTGDALDFTWETLAINQLTLHAFADVSDARRRLRTACLQTAIHPTGSPKILDAAVNGAKLEGLFDAVLSVERSACTTRSPRCISSLSTILGRRHARLRSNCRMPATPAPPMQVVWCNRYGQGRRAITRPA